MASIRDQIFRLAEPQLLYLPHAVRQMSRPDRMITSGEVRKVVETGDIIEDYPEDIRGHSVLIQGNGNDGRIIHVVCAPKDDYLAIITAYVPDPALWNDDYKTRK